MGTVTQQLARAAMAAGAQVETGRPVVGISVQGGSVSGVQLADGTEVGPAQRLLELLCCACSGRVYMLLWPGQARSS